MNMFDPQRPKTASGQARLLADDGYIPHVIVMPLPEGKAFLSLMLRNYDDSASRSYSYRHATVQFVDLGAFFSAYVSDPEAALLSYFAWEAKPIASQTHQPSPIDTTNSFDLL
jgi:hypothetical protein